MDLNSGLKIKKTIQKHKFIIKEFLIVPGQALCGWFAGFRDLGTG